MLVSTIITTFKRPEMVKKAIYSALAQTYRPVEIIVVEDGTESGIKAWLEDRGFEQIKYISHKNNKGLAASRNTGWRNANGEYIAFLDDDDVWKPEKLQRQMDLISRLDKEQIRILGVVYCGNEIHFSNGTVRVRKGLTNIGKLKDCIIKYGAQTVPSSSIIPKNVLKKIGGFDESLASSIDHDIWMNLAVNDYHAFLVDEPLVICYAPDNGKTMTTAIEPRIQGVQQHVKKWVPVYQEWLGAKQGDIYAQRYFAKVIANLAAEKIVAGNMSETAQSIGAVFSFSKQYSFNFLILAKKMALKIIRHKLPDNLILCLKKAAIAVGLKRSYGK
jgi:glycosyltransferase involved in cell wall biosynthesis